MSRSEDRRIARQKGEPVPTFGPDGLKEAFDATPEQLGKAAVCSHPPCEWGTEFGTFVCTKHSEQAENDAKGGSTADDQTPANLPPHRCQG